MGFVLTIVVENEPGALCRVVGLFSQRNLNIDSLVVKSGEGEGESEIAITVRGGRWDVEKLNNKLNSLVCVVESTFSQSF